MPDPTNIARRVAAALALACGLDWGRWAAGLTADRCTCGLARVAGDAATNKLSHCSPCGVYDPPTPVADPFKVEAYLADCARRGVEPGPLPTMRYAPCWADEPQLKWASEDGRCSWTFTPASALHSIYVTMRVGDAHVDYNGTRFAVHGPPSGSISGADLREMASMVEAVSIAVAPMAAVGSM